MSILNFGCILELPGEVCKIQVPNATPTESSKIGLRCGPAIGIF